MAKIGILGGTFNPIHNGHLALAKAAYEQYALDEVWLMPSKIPPHKAKKGILSEQHRLRMTELSAQTEPFFRASDWELKREGTTYTVDTMQELTTEFPEHRFYFIIGGDSALSFLSWREPKRILSYTNLLAGGRAGCEEENVKEMIRTLNTLTRQGKAAYVSLPNISISSSDIRTAIEMGVEEEAKKMIPTSVFQYIKEQKLYGFASLAALEAKMQRELPPKRYRHTVGVEHLSAAYAACYEVNQDKAMLAGVLHDCAKMYTDEELLTLSKEYGLEITPAEERNGFLLHAKVGAYFAKTKYGITDEDILSAIFYHTTGRPNMSIYEKITFLADYLEPFRTQPITPPLQEVRKLAFQDIDKAICIALKNTIQYITENGQELEQTTMQAFLYYNEVTKLYENPFAE